MIHAKPLLYTLMLQALRHPRARSSGPHWSAGSPRSPHFSGCCPCCRWPCGSSRSSSGSVTPGGSGIAAAVARGHGSAGPLRGRARASAGGLRPARRLTVVGERVPHPGLVQDVQQVRLGDGGVVDGGGHVEREECVGAAPAEQRAGTGLRTIAPLLPDQQLNRHRGSADEQIARQPAQEAQGGSRGSLAAVTSLLGYPLQPARQLSSSLHAPAIAAAPAPPRTTLDARSAALPI
jgi:hypothetical protein